MGNPQDAYTASHADLVKYATYAGLAYQTTDAWPASRTVPKDTTLISSFDHTLKGSSGYIAFNEPCKEIIVAYRGTDSLIDWLTNLNFDKTAWPANISNSLVHEGFLNAYLVSMQQVQEAVDSLLAKCPDATISFTGHSLGGALACISMVDTAQRHRGIKMQMFTYGQPRTGNQAFAEYVENLGHPVFRVVYRHDIVPRMPPMDLGFQHHGQEVWYEGDENIKFCKGEGENLTCELGVPFSELNAKDHSEYPGMH
ncbi:alpha/beta-hydrolase [Linderina pennispora]|uniref:Alpha/beta-hydrolase n=1 Tax=Linderina pennispora TaxID=61395 RepID=A0A1Y1WN76_9FUNG|nr:alpha/beta-hydrolase [Linderina pennispora]ORX74963.1 alpha/beta-hydrolase [Linderina pennispora]